MTQKRDLKRRVRERQTRTGESYMTALRHVRGEQRDAGEQPEPDEQPEPGGAATGDPTAGAQPTGEPTTGALTTSGTAAGAPSGESSAGPIPVVELVDVSDVAAAVGLTCRATVMPALLERVGATALLVQLRDVLRTTAGDPAFATLRAAALLGERPSLEPGALRARGHSAVVPDDTLRFAARVRAGVGGITSNGRSLAFSVTGRTAAELVVFSLWLLPPPYDQRPPALLITTPDQLSINVRFGLEALLP
ncbi:MAG: hypothetical protein ABIY55_26685 [Kofleriaceae bacterium]